MTAAEVLVRPAARDLRGATVVYLAACDWDAPWHGPQEIASRLAAAGARVLYVETLGWRRPRAFDLPRVVHRLRHALRGHSPHGGRTAMPSVISPVLIPGARSRIGRSINRRVLVGLLRRRLGRIDGPLILWVYTPSRLALELVEALGPSLVLYHATQAHRYRPYAPADTADVEEHLIRRSDLVLCDALMLYEELKAKHPHVYRSPSGVDVAGYASARAAAWAHELPRPLLGYVGTIDHRVDLGLLAYVAREHPEWTIALVGPIVDAHMEQVAHLGNVVTVGEVAAKDLPRTLAAFDVGLMPYADLQMTRYTFPAKLYQYLAAALPIVSTPLPDLEEYAGLVHIGCGQEGFLAAVESAMTAPRRRAERRRVAAANTWSRRFTSIQAVLADHLGES